MSDPYTDRCNILKQWLEIRETVVHIRAAYERMSSTHTAYRDFQVMIEEKRAELTKMERENPWMQRVLTELGHRV